MHNERVKLLATALDNIGAGSIIAGIVAPTVTGAVGDAARIVLWLARGASFISLAYGLLGRIA